MIHPMWWKRLTIFSPTVAFDIGFDDEFIGAGDVVRKNTGHSSVQKKNRQKFDTIDGNFDFNIILFKSDPFAVFWRFPSAFPLNTWRNNDVVITSKQRHFDVITSKWRRFDVITTSLLRNVFAGLLHSEQQEGQI